MQLLTSCCMLKTSIVVPLLQQPTTATVLHDALSALAAGAAAEAAPAAAAQGKISTVAGNDEQIDTSTVGIAQDGSWEKALAAMELIQAFVQVDEVCGPEPVIPVDANMDRDASSKRPIVSVLLQACPWLPQVCVHLGMHAPSLEHADTSSPAAHVARAARAMVAALHVWLCRVGGLLDLLEVRQHIVHNNTGRVHSSALGVATLHFVGHPHAADTVAAKRAKAWRPANQVARGRYPGLAARFVS